MASSDGKASPSRENAEDKQDGVHVTPDDVFGTLQPKAAAKEPGNAHVNKPSEGHARTDQDESEDLAESDEMEKRSLPRRGSASSSKRGHGDQDEDWDDGGLTPRTRQRIRQGRVVEVISRSASVDSARSHHDGRHQNDGDVQPKISDVEPRGTRISKLKVRSEGHDDDLNTSMSRSSSSAMCVHSDDLLHPRPLDLLRTPSARGMEDKAGVRNSAVLDVVHSSPPSDQPESQRASLSQRIFELRPALASRLAPRLWGRMQKGGNSDKPEATVVSVSADYTFAGSSGGSVRSPPDTLHRTTVVSSVPKDAPLRIAQTMEGVTRVSENSVQADVDVREKPFKAKTLKF
jgi:hypothetical protein